jgi:signal transduction histidine kinase
VKSIDLHEGLDSTLLILQHRLKNKSTHLDIQLVKDYAELPLVECYAGQLNQVFMNLMSNAIDALEDQHYEASNQVRSEPPTIWIQTKLLDSNRVAVHIKDNGPGMTEKIHCRLFDPFFTTKAVGKGTGLGLSISHQIVTEKHGGQLRCISAPGLGAEFIIEIPLRQTPINGQC